jgi:hypothetical protein
MRWPCGFHWILAPDWTPLALDWPFRDSSRPSVLSRIEGALQQLQQRGCKNAQISTSHLFYVHLLLLLRSGGDNKRRDFKPVLLVGEILPGGKRVPLHLLLSLHRSCLCKRLCKQERRVHPPTLVHFALQRRFYRKCPQQIYHFEKSNFVEARFSCLWCTSGFAVW